MQEPADADEGNPGLEINQFLRGHLIGAWIGVGTKVVLAETFLRFEMGELSYQEPVAFESGYAGYVANSLRD